MRRCVGCPERAECQRWELAVTNLSLLIGLLEYAVSVLKAWRHQWTDSP